MSRAEMERQVRQGFILEAARSLFSKKGLENCTMDDIASAAEYTRRTLYSYFKGRDELYLRIHIEDLERRWALQQEALVGIEGGLARILVWAKALYAFSRANSQAQRMQSYWDFRGIDPERIDPAFFSRFEALNEELADGLRTLFREGIADGSLRSDLDVDMSISQFLYSLRAVIDRALSPAYSFADFDADAYLDHFLSLFCRGVHHPGDSK